MAFVCIQDIPDIVSLNCQGHVGIVSAIIRTRPVESIMILKCLTSNVHKMQCLGCYILESCYERVHSTIS